MMLMLHSHNIVNLWSFRVTHVAQPKKPPRIPSRSRQQYPLNSVEKKNIAGRKKCKTCKVAEAPIGVSALLIHRTDRLFVWPCIHACAHGPC